MHNLVSSTRRPDITFYRSGLIRLTARVTRTLQIRPGDSINIAADNGELLIFAIHNNNPLIRRPATCYPTNHGNNMCANSINLCRSLLDNLGITSNRAAFYVGYPIDIENTIYLPIITRNPIINP